MLASRRMPDAKDVQRTVQPTVISGISSFRKLRQVGSSGHKYNVQN